MRVKKTYNLYLVYLVVQVIAAYILYFFVDYNSLDPMVYNIIGQLLFFIPTIVVGISMFGKPVMGKTNFLDCTLAVLLAFAVEPLISLLSLATAMFFPNNVTEAFQIAYESPLVISIISMAVFPALLEEIVFRGFIFSGFKNTKLKHACIVAGLLFAFAHNDLQQFLYAFFVGVLLCYVCYKTKSIIPGIITHFTINATQIMMSRASFSSEAVEQTLEAVEAISYQEVFFMYLRLSVISLPVIFLIIKMMGRRVVLAPEKKFVDFTKVNDIEMLEISDESVYDYNPEYPEKIFNWKLLLIILLYLIQFYYYFLS